MIADRLITNIGQLVSAVGVGALRGVAMCDLHITTDAAVAIHDGHVVWVGRRQDWNGIAAETQDAEGCSVIPGLVDPHTHIVWGGDRLDDFDARSRGVPYETMLADGGGIRHTVACTANASDDDLLAAAVQRAAQMIRAGATTIEVKSGYGESWEHESRQLATIRRMRAHLPVTLVPTMLFHLPPHDASERAVYLRVAESEWMPAIAAAQLATGIDVFIERDAFAPDDAARLMRAAAAHGLTCKAHTDQFNVLGGTEVAIAHGALSADHLEQSGPAQIAALAASRTAAVLLPGVTLHLGLPAAPGRALVDAGAVVAIGTDCNPGSSPLFSMALAMGLGVRLNGLTLAEAFVACTANAAAALGQTQAGRIAPGMRADLLLLKSTDWRDVPYVMGESVIDRVMLAGADFIS